MIQKCSFEKSLLLFGVAALWTPFAVSADPAQGTSSPRKLAKSGLLATSAISGASSTILGDTFGGEELFAKDLPPLTGSVSRKDDATWTIGVSNNSQDRYTVNVDLVQKNESGSTVKFSSYSYSLRPGQSEHQDARAGTNASRAELHLRSYRNLTEEQKQREGSK
jgi:hypothetical protein